MTADALFAPLTAAAFLDRHWPEQAAALPADDRRLALFPTLHDRSIRELVGSYPGPIHAVATENTDGRLTAVGDSVAALRAFDAGTSLCLGGLHAVLPEVRAALEALTVAVAVPVQKAQCNAYVSPVGEGVPWHFDDREVFVVHLQGSKRWTLAPNSDVAYPTMNFVLATQAPDEGDELALYAPPRIAGPLPELQRDVLMTPGTAVFMPRGTWHRTLADAPSLSLTFGLFTPTALDVLLQQVRSWAVRDARFRLPLALASEAQASATQSRLESLFADWRASVGAPGGRRDQPAGPPGSPTLAGTA